MRRSAKGRKGKETEVIRMPPCPCLLPVALIGWISAGPAVEPVARSGQGTAAGHTGDGEVDAMRSMTGFRTGAVAGWRAAAVGRGAQRQPALPRREAVAAARVPGVGVELRELVSGVAERGKVDVTIFRAGSSGDDFTVEVNEPLARAASTAGARCSRTLKLPGDDRRRHADDARRQRLRARRRAQAPTRAPTCRASSSCWRRR